MLSSVEAKRALLPQRLRLLQARRPRLPSKPCGLRLAHEKLPISVTEILPASINTPFFDKARTKIGVKPMGLPPIYPPALVADTILHAAEHPAREIVVEVRAR